MNSINLVFPKVIYKNILSCLNDNLINQYKNYIDSNKVKEHDGNGYYTNDQFILNNPLFIDVKNEINYHVMEYIKILSHKVNSIQVTSSWGNVVDKNNSINTHLHGNSYISGVFYLTGGSSLLFYAQNAHKDFTFGPEVEFDKDKPWTFQRIGIPAEVGSIILFPSLIMHSVEENKSDDERYSVAFNTIPTGMIGSTTNKLEILPL